jgi:hypothetical protein
LIIYYNSLIIIKVITFSFPSADEKSRALALMDGDHDSDDEDGVSEHEDPDVLADPLNSLNLEQVLVQHFRSLSHRPIFPTLLAEVGPAARRCLENCITAAGN